MFRELFYLLYEDFQKRGHFKRKKFKGIKRKIFMLDSTIISVCIKVFDWAKYKKEKGAIKLHTLLDYDGCMPKYVYMTEGKRADVKHANYMLMPPGSVIVADRAYIDFKMLYRWMKDKIIFVIRLKDAIKYEQVEEFALPEEKDQQIIKDEKIRLTGDDTRDLYPEYLRRVVVYSKTDKSDVEIVTNNFSWTASTIAELYKQRWQVETFFKELKQHLKIKSFLGTNENAMWIQIWTALITLLLMKYLKEISKYNWSLSNLIAFLRMNLFVKILLAEWLDNPFKAPEDFSMENRQQNLF
jgi:IS4 transposase